jgi:hypothetical protein
MDATFDVHFVLGGCRRSVKCSAIEQFDPSGAVAVREAGICTRDTRQQSIG